MSNDFARLRKSQSVEALQNSLAKQNKFQRDERYWKPSTDEQGNGYAVIRFLPAPPTDLVPEGSESADPYVLYYKHSFKAASGQYYIERSLTTLGKPDPCAELNNRLWAAGRGDKESKECKQASVQKRKATYISNIQVINDPAHPEFNGKTFLYEYGKKIMQKIQDKLPGKQTSQFVDPDDVKFNAFNLWEGANFKLRISRQEGTQFPNYDKSEFLVPGPLFVDDDEKMEAAWKSGYSLQAEMAPEKFKSYEDLKNRLNTVLGLGGETSGAAPVAVQDTPAATIMTQVQARQAEVTAAVTPTAPALDDEEDDFAAFQALANGVK